MPTYEGRLDATGMRVAIVAGRFNDLITKSLVEGATSTLRRHGLDEAGITVAWVPGAFEIPLAAELVEGATSTLRRHGLDEAGITVAWVPGAFEIPLAAERLAASGEFDAVICLGAVIRGATPHFDYVSGQCAAGVSRASHKTGVPVIFGVLTTDTIEQAVERSGTKAGNKGTDAAIAAVEMVDLLRQLPKPGDGPHT